MSQWPKWLRRQYGKLEICGSSPGYDTNFSLKIIIYMSIWYKKKIQYYYVDETNSEEIDDCEKLEHNCTLNPLSAKH